MNKTFILGLSLLTVGTAVLPGTLGIVAHADETNAISSTVQNSNSLVASEVNSLDEYVIVENNQYKLELPSKVAVSDEAVAQARSLVDESNKVVSTNNFVINPITKVATDPNARYARYTEGKTDIEVHWNYARIYVSKSTANALKNGTIGAAGVFAGKIPNIYTQAAAAALLAIAGAIDIKGGFYFDFNYLLGNQGYHWQ